MSRLLKTSGFLGLTVQMLWGMGNVVYLMGSPPAFWAEWVGAHAHFGVLGILAVATGFAVDHFETSGTRRTVVVYGFVLGQWLLPATLVAQGVTGMHQIGILEFVWGLCLLAAMAVMTLEAWNKG
ncbi:hypothetical protein [Halocalculus aciditolerans]|uniref:DUF8059 domain-containing protein n=1 Tax=Halocalculus aciditolerans TaxID=1383812 RepID=A0A830F3W6_9EURY|nr:hypothetical protein [Halocalculus aciditolerans]GGL52654.1 hypothetical protein GCM10009039_08620 [Halocalculus aciditolerans]